MEMIKEIKLKECDFCNENKPEVYDVDIYQPFKTEPNFSGKVCDDCHSDNYYTCEICGRNIFETNGMRINLRWNKETEGYECVSCLHKHWFENGMEKFNDADWFNDSELSKAGFNKHKSLFIRSESSIIDGKSLFSDLQKINRLVIVSIEMSGMGLEYHIALWIKEKKEVVK